VRPGASALVAVTLVGVTVFGTSSVVGCGNGCRETSDPSRQGNAERAEEEEGAATDEGDALRSPSAPTGSEESAVARARRAAAAAAAGERLPLGPAPAPGPTEDFMLALADGRARLDALVDPERGVLFVSVLSDVSGEDPRAGSDGMIRRAERVCGRELSPRLDRLREDLARRVEVHGERAAFRCTGDTCRYRATMEFDVDGEFVFATGGPAGVRLDRVIEVEGEMDDSFYARERPWVDARVRALGGGRCAASASQL
jgi:hypothetical protein